MAVARLNSCLHSGNIYNLSVITILNCVALLITNDLKAVHLLGKPSLLSEGASLKTRFSSEHILLQEGWD